ncbi:MAG: nucleotidyltransferase family protein, partial [Clostridia bacterium]|nr:nucleotidyltransferase family protein [Clostridia bacterium]
VPDQLSSPVLFALRSLGKDGIRALPEVSEGLENPIYEAALRSSDLNELLEAVKTKRYTMARLKRIMISALLGSTEDLQKRAASEPDGLYIRVLGVRAEKANELLSALCSKASLPVITAAKDVPQLSDTAKEVFEHACRAQRILPLACPERRGASADFPEQIIVS